MRVYCCSSTIFWSLPRTHCEPISVTHHCHHIINLTNAPPVVNIVNYYRLGKTHHIAVLHLVCAKVSLRNLCNTSPNRQSPSPPDPNYAAGVPEKAIEIMTSKGEIVVFYFPNRDELEEWLELVSSSINGCSNEWQKQFGLDVMEMMVPHANQEWHSCRLCLSRLSRYRARRRCENCQWQICRKCRVPGSRATRKSRKRNRGVICTTCLQLFSGEDGQ